MKQSIAPPSIARRPLAHGKFRRAGITRSGFPAADGLPLWLFTLIAAAALAVGAVSEAPTPAVAVQGISALAEQVLLDRVRVLLTRVAEAEKTFAAEEGALKANRELVEAHRARLAGVAVLTAKPAEKDGMTRVEATEAARDHQKERLAILKDSLKALEQVQSGLQEQIKRLEAAAAAARERVHVLGELQPLAQEMERREASGVTLSLRLPEGRSAKEIADQLALLAQTQETRKQARTQIEKELEGLPPRIEQTRAAGDEAEAQLAAAEQAYNEALKREAIEKEMLDKDPESVAALLVGAVAERERIAGGRAKAQTAFTEAEAAVAGIEKAFPPDPETISLASTNARAAAAEKALKLAEAMAAYHTNRVRRLQQEQAALALLQEKAVAALQEAELAEANILRLQVLSQRVAALIGEGKLSAGNLPSQAQPSILAADRGKIAEALARLETAKAAGLRAKQIPELIKEALQAADAERAKLGELRANYEAELSIVRFVREVESLSTPKVVAHFKEALERRAARQAALVELREDWSKTEAALRKQEARLAALEDPLVLIVQQQNANLHQQILNQLNKKAGLDPIPQPGSRDSPSQTGRELPPPASATSQSTQPAAPAPVPPARLASDAPLSSEMILTGLVARAESLSSRLRVFQERGRERAAVAQAIMASTNALDTLLKAYSDASESANRAYAAALELQTRVGLGTAAASDLPPKVSEALDRKLILAMEAEAAELRKARTVLEVWLQDQARESERASKRLEVLQRGVKVVGQKLDTIQVRADLEAVFQREAAGYTEIEAKRLDQQALARMEAEHRWHEKVLGIFHSPRAEQVEELIRGDYREQLKFERKRANLELRSTETERLIRLAEDERKVAQELLPLVSDELVRHRAEAAAAQVRAGLVSATDEKALTELAAANRPAPKPTELTPETIPSMADLVFGARMRVMGTETRIHQLEGRLSRFGIDAELGFRRDELGAYQARMDTINREMGRLKGRPEKELAEMDPLERPKTKAEETRFLTGEIGWLRLQRTDLLTTAGIVSVVTLIAIPLLALLALRMLRHSSQRIVKRVRAEGDESGVQREQRAQTLVNVFNAAMTAVISVVAAIYMLKQFRIDVTPIIASAGVAGLAIAFGAQALIRDYFTGFFMLLENQYKIGDIIKIGDIGGVVERITLRLTVLRDLHGVVHFVPNGTVHLVSNMTKGWSRAVLEIGVAYKEDPDRVIEVLRQVGREMYQDPVFRSKLADMPEVPGVEQFGDSSITVRMLLKTRPAEQWNVAREARRRIKHAFDAAGIEIPFPQRVVTHLHPQRLGPTPPEEGLGESKTQV